MRLNKRQQAKGRKLQRAEAEREKDMVYWVLFQRKEWREGDPRDNRYFPPVNVPLDASKHPEMYQHAIEQFQLIHKVSDWRTIASGHTHSGFPNP